MILLRAMQFHLISTSLVLVCLLSGCQSDSAPSTKQTDDRPPNVLIIFTDDQGYQDVGCFGSPDILTPNIDGMAKNGARFSQFYVAQPVCSASRAALLSGSYPSRLGIQGALFPKAKIGLNPEEETIAEILKAEGYATAAFGKWHLGDHPDLSPLKQGFDEYFGIPFSNDMWPLHPSNDHFQFEPLPLIEQDSVLTYLEDQSQLTTQITEHAVSFIERNQDEPFFLYVAHPMPHVPLYVSDKFKGKSERGLYGDVIMEIDWSVGQMLGTLKKLGMEENTLVIFTSDNGPWLSYGDHSGEALPLREGKGTALEGGVRVPCVMQWPGHIPAGLEQLEAAMTIDLLPTIAQLTGAKLPEKPIDGKNIWPLMAGEEGATSPQEAYFFYYKSNELQAVLQSPWKLYLPHTYRSMTGRPGGTDGLPKDYEQLPMGLELYHLDNDLSETQNVAEQHPEIVAHLSALADSMRRELGDGLTQQTGISAREPGRVVWE